jgi:hypothetical protein
MAPLPTAEARQATLDPPGEYRVRRRHKGFALAGWSCGARAERELRAGGKAGLPTTKAIDLHLARGKAGEGPGGFEHAEASRG